MKRIKTTRWKEIGKGAPVALLRKKREFKKKIYRREERERELWQWKEEKWIWDHFSNLLVFRDNWAEKDRLFWGDFFGSEEGETGGVLVIFWDARRGTKSVNITYEYRVSLKL